MDTLPGFNLAHILVVESDPKVADYISAVLRSGGYLVQSVTYVGEALTIDHSRFNLAVVNGALRDAKGVDIRERIRQVTTFAVLPVLFINLDSRPIDESELLDKVQAMLVRGANHDHQVENWDEVLEAQVNNPEPMEPDQARKQPLTEDDIPTEPTRLTFDLHLKQQLAELKILANLARSISSVLELSEVLNQIVEAATTLTQAEEGMLLLPDDQHKALYLRAMKGVDDRSGKNFRVRVEDPLVGRVFTSGEPILLSDKGLQRVKTEYFVKSLLYVPLTYKKQIIGVLGIQNRVVSRAFNFHDQELLLDLAAHAAIAIENARLYEERLLQNRQLTMLVDAGKAVNSTLALGDVLTILCQQMIQALEVNACVISQQDAQSGDLYPLAEVRRIAWRGEQGPQFNVHNRPILKKALDQNAFYSLRHGDHSGADWKPEIDLLTHYNAQEMLVLPIRPANQPVMGIVELYYADSAPEVTDEFRAGMRGTAIEVFAHLSDASASLPLRTIFSSAENILSSAHADWLTMALLYDQATLVKMVEYGSAVFVNEALPKPMVLPHRMADFGDQALLSYNVRDAALTDKIKVAMATAGAEALLSMPLTIKGKPFGAVTLYNTQGTRRFRNEEISLASTLVTQAATAIDNARLFNDLERSLADLQQAQASLVQAARLSTIGELSAVVAHQINNPLTTIMADAEIILQDLAPSDPLREGVMAIHRAGVRAHTVVKRLLSTARRDIAQDELRQIELHETIRATLELITTHIERSKMKFDISLADSSPIYVQAAPGHLEDLWLNLLLNARDALLNVSQPTITLRSYIVPDGVEVTICDNGNGIPPEIIPHIFEPFFTTKPVGEGTGLGLYICKQILDRCGGTIHCDSVLNQGTCFQILLPSESQKAD